jgi:hypothetical protein
VVVACPLAYHARLGCIQMPALRGILGLEMIAADVEPHRRIERRVLVDQDESELRLEIFGVIRRREVSVL